LIFVLFSFSFFSSPLSPFPSTIFMPCTYSNFFSFLVAFLWCLGNKGMV
jgi:hypothetical protein